MQFSDVYNLFFAPGEVVEIRAYGLSKSNKAWEGWAGGAGIVYGYFDNAEAFGACAAALENAKAPGIYFTLNPVVPDLLARAQNRLKAADQKTVTTADKDILCIRWLPIDLDPVRPTGISSTDAELKAAGAVAKKIIAWMQKEIGLIVSIRGVSGNGCHILYLMNDVPVTDDNVNHIKNSLRALQAKFGTKKVNVDTGVYNPARIWKLYGATARKGDNTKTRPHRKSYIVEE